MKSLIQKFHFPLFFYHFFIITAQNWFYCKNFQFQIIKYIETVVTIVKTTETRKQLRQRAPWDVSQLTFLTAVTLTSLSLQTTYKVSLSTVLNA